MNKRDIYPYWELHKHGSTPPRQKLPKHLRVKNSLGLRIIKGIKVDKKTGEYKVRR